MTPPSTWLTLPDLQRGREHRAHRPRRRRPARNGRARATSACSSSTTSRRTGPARSPTAWRRSCPRSRSCIARSRTAWAAPTSPASATPSAGAPSSSASWTPTSPTTRRTPEILEAAEHSDVVLGSRYVKGGQIVNWPPLRRLLSRGGSLYARTILGVHVRDLTGGFKCVHRRVLERDRASTLRAQGYVFNIELTYRAAHGRVQGHRGADHLPRPRRRAQQDVARRSPSRRCSWSRACGATAARRRPRRRGPCRRGRRGARPHAGPLRAPPRLAVQEAEAHERRRRP